MTLPKSIFILSLVFLGFSWSFADTLGDSKEIYKDEDSSAVESEEEIDEMVFDDWDVPEWASEFEELYELRKKYEEEHIRIGKYMDDAVEKLKLKLFKQMDHGIANLTKSMRFDDAEKLRSLKDSFPAIFFIESPDDYPMELSIFIKYSQRLFQPLLKKEKNSYRVLKIKYQRRAKALLKKQADAGALENALLAKEFIEEIESLPLSQFEDQGGKDADVHSSSQNFASGKKLGAKMVPGLACQVFFSAFPRSYGSSKEYLLKKISEFKENHAPSEAIILSQKTISLPENCKDKTWFWVHLKGEMNIPKSGKYQFSVEDLRERVALTLSVNGLEVIAVADEEKKSGEIQYTSGWYSIDIWYQQTYREEQGFKLLFGPPGDMNPISGKFLRHREDTFMQERIARAPVLPMGFKRGLMVETFKGSNEIVPWKNGNSCAFPESSLQQAFIMPTLSIPDFLKSTDHFGLHFTGHIWIPETGTYCFQLFGDDHVRLCIDGKDIGESSNVKGEAHLERGWVSIEAWHLERYGAERLWLKYGRQGEELIEVPREYLAHNNRRHLK